MTNSQIITSAITCAAAIAAVIAAALAWRAQQQGRDTLAAIRSERRTFAVPGGLVTVTAPMSEAEYAELKTRWQGVRSKPGTSPLGPVGASSSGQGRVVDGDVYPD